MRCHCNPPLPAKLAQVQKAGDNFGRPFYTCPNRSCKLFSWADGARPNNIQGTSSASASGPVGAPGGAIINATLPSAPSARTTRTVSSMSGANGSNAMNALNSTSGNGIKVTLGIGEVESTGLDQRIWVSILAPNDARLFRILNSLPAEAKKFHHGMRMWMIDLAQYETFVCAVRALECFDVIELPRFLLHGLPVYLKHLPRTVTEPDLLPKMASTILPFQLDGLRFVIRRGGRALIGDEMGCGKTVSAIAILEHYRRELPALILVPANLGKQWRAELLNYASDMLTETDICLVAKSSDTVRGRVCIVPYSVLDKLVDRGAIRAEQFGIVIADESHQLKNKDAKRTEIALPFIKRASVAICLSGTPILNRPVEMFTQLNALLPRVFSSYEEFTQRYCNARPSNFGSGWDVSGSSNERELNLLLEGIVMVRRLKADVVKSLPTKRREIRYIKPDPAYVGQLHAIQKDQQVVMAALQSAGNDNQIVQKLKREQQQLTLRYNQVTGLSKVAGVSVIIRELIAKARQPPPDTLTSEPPVDSSASAIVSADSSADCPSASISMPGAESKGGLMLDLTVGEDGGADTPFPVYRTDPSAMGAMGTARSVDVRRTDQDDDLLFAESSAVKLVSEGGASVAAKKEEDDWMRDSDEDSGKDKVSACDEVPHKNTTATLCEAKAGLSRLKRNARRIESRTQDGDGGDAGEPVLKRRSLRISTLYRRVVYCPDDDDYNEADGSEGGILSGRQSNRESSRKGETDVEEEDIGLIEMDSDGDDLFFIDKPPTDIISKNNAPGKNSRRARVEDDLKDGVEFADSESDGFNDDDDEEGVDENTKKSAQLWKDILDGKGRDTSTTSRRRGRKSPTEGVHVLPGASGSIALNADKAGVTASLFKRKSKLHQKILIFAHHREVMNRLEDCLREEQVDYIRLDGSVATASRNTFVLDFQQNDEADVALLSLSACGTGLNLTAASTALFAELAWSPGTILQAEDRIHRIGQKSSAVRIVYAIAEGSADDIVWEQIQKKHSVVGATVGSSDAGNRMVVAKSDRGVPRGQQRLDDLLSQTTHPNKNFSVSSCGTNDESTVCSSGDSGVSHAASGKGSVRTKSDDVYNASVNKKSAVQSSAKVANLCEFDFDNIPADIIEQQIAIAESIFRNGEAATHKASAANDININTLASTGKHQLSGKLTEENLSPFVYSVPEDLKLDASSLLAPETHRTIPRPDPDSVFSKGSAAPTFHTDLPSLAAVEPSAPSKPAPKTNSAAVYGLGDHKSSAIASNSMERLPLQVVSHQDQGYKPNSHAAPPATLITTHPASDSSTAVKSSAPLDAATLRRMEEKRREALQRLEERRRQQLRDQSGSSNTSHVGTLQASVHLDPVNTPTAPLTNRNEIHSVRPPAKVSPPVEEHHAVKKYVPTLQRPNPYDKSSESIKLPPKGTSGASALHVFETGNGRSVEVASDISSAALYGVDGTIGGTVKPDISVQRASTMTTVSSFEKQFLKEAPPPIFSTIPASWTQNRRQPSGNNLTTMQPTRPEESAVAVHSAAVAPQPVSAGGGRPMRSID